MKLFLGWDPTSSTEVSAEDVRAADRYSRRFFDESGALVRVELYRRGDLIEVDYYSGETAEHSRDYPGIDFAVVRKMDAPAGFRWELTARHDPDGEVQRYIAELVDPDDTLVMSVEYNVAGEVEATTKYWDELPDQDGMMFEYGPDGKNVGVADLEDGNSLRFADVLRALPEPDFYADGLVLPRELSGTSIPAVPDSFRR
jgi:hypothetical protein